MIYILGAGGYGRVVLNIYLDLDRYHEVGGFLEENCQRQGQLVNGKPVYDVSVLSTLSDVKLVCAIGNPLVRSRLINSLANYEYDTIIHPAAIIPKKWVQIGKGSIIMAGVMFRPQNVIEDHVVVNIQSSLGHDTRVGKYTNIAQGVLIAGGVSIGSECYIGMGSIIKEYVSIGKRTFIGAGAVVVDDIPDNVLAVGVPAKPTRTLDASTWEGLI